MDESFAIPEDNVIGLGEPFGGIRVVGVGDAPGVVCTIEALGCYCLLDGFDADVA